jgi:Fur family peroxide stress response transcriptional regulator
VKSEQETMLATLRKRGLRITPQRIALVEAFASDSSHPTAQELFERLRPAFPSMSFATVYNTLDALAQAGLSSTLHLGGAARFDPNTTPHHHAVCDACGAAFDVPAHSLAPNDSSASRVHKVAPGFVVRRVEQTYRGMCASCHSKKTNKEN